MKFFIATIVVIALAQETFAQEAINLDVISQKFEELKTKLVDLLNNQDLGQHTHAILEERKNQIEPMINKAQEQIKNMKEQIEPLSTNLRAQVQPMLQMFQEQMEATLKLLSDRANVLTN
ncbi:type-4 ice-structuring protein LS-12-like [Corythoichthys intestinalis]|uniref:type-4 ice-structuring protein LS-12-like n=1 Tax=Corythoichthys intestinalis TaxID=161448 RepID=UPI0025A5BB70|nr:type-4 ice-structuring protein LS-12-like [Corythoichthys intestinalis]XP_057684364.1 type-4 ice-structuring protein LS-12-like [Corythoichthys intestinalis]XP_061808756.1 type-4 ice-structuring protein LS-12-like [Nerophis lumbriciformis]